MNIRLARLEDLQQITDVLNRVTLDLQQKNIYQWAYPWDSSEIEHAIKKQEGYVLLLDEKITGTFFISDIHSLSELSIEPGSKYLSKVAILPEFQGKSLGSKIIDFACSLAKNSRKTLYLDCWAGNEKLKAFYCNNGLEYRGDFPEEDYLISIFKYDPAK